MRSSATTFVRGVKRALFPVRDVTKSYVDDMAVHSDTFPLHLQHIKRFLVAIEASGLTLGLNKCNFAHPEIKFIGHIIGSGHRRADPAKVAAVEGLKEPETKKEVRQAIGLFSFFREYIPNFAAIAKPLTDLTSKRFSDRVSFGEREREAFNTLKQLLCKAANEPMRVIDPNRQFTLFVDSSMTAVGAVLTQTDESGHLYPVAFASNKLTPTMQHWSTVEREAYAAIWGLQKYKQWIFFTRVILVSDHNPLTFLVDSIPKSAKLMRWSLALQEFDIDFRFRAGKSNEAADCLSRMVR